MYSPLISFVLITLVSCLPNGAPNCVINDANIAKGHIGPSESSLGYSLFVKPAGKNVWNISILNKGNLQDFQGLLMYVHQVNKPNAHLGKFIIPTTVAKTSGSSTKWKFQPLDLCSSQSIQSSSKESTLTHANSIPVKVGNQTLVSWTSDRLDELALEGLVVNAVVATTSSGSKKIKWQHLQYFGIPPIPIATKTANGTKTIVTASRSSTTPTSSPGLYPPPANSEFVQSTTTMGNVNNANGAPLVQVGSIFLYVYMGFALLLITA